MYMKQYLASGRIGIDGRHCHDTAYAEGGEEERQGATNMYIDRLLGACGTLEDFWQAE